MLTRWTPTVATSETGQPPFIAMVENKRGRYILASAVPPNIQKCLGDPENLAALEALAEMIANGWLGNRGAMNTALDRAYARRRFAAQAQGETK